LVRETPDAGRRLTWVFTTCVASLAARGLPDGAALQGINEFRQPGIPKI